MRVCVVGSGHIGLPTAAIIADSGIDVIAADINEEIVRKINEGNVSSAENGVEELVKKVSSSGRLKASTDVTGSVRESDVVIIIVPTPLKKDGPDMGAIRSAAESVAKGLKKGSLVVLESTVYPGTTSELIKPRLEESGLKCGEDFYLAYSPERAMPTRILEEVRKDVRIVGGVDEKSSEKAKDFYSKFVESDVVAVKDSTVAEFIKTCENVYRDVNIALANELALVADKLGIDIEKVISAANKHPRVAIHRPGAGVGGHCIPKDPYFLINKAKEAGMEMRLVKTAREINEKMPEIITSEVEEGLKSVGKSVKGTRIAVLGYAYKGDTDDSRGTPSEKIVNSLKSLGGDVHVHDPYIGGNGFARNLDDAVRGSGCIVLVTDHSEYRKLNIGKLANLMTNPAVLIDGRNIFDKEKVEAAGIKYFGIGK